MDFVVELKPFIGKQATFLGTFEIEHNQYHVMLNGKGVGVVGKYPGAVVKLTQKLPEQVKQKLKSEVDRLLGGVSNRIADANPIEEEVEVDGVQES